MVSIIVQGLSGPAEDFVYKRACVGIGLECKWHGHYRAPFGVTISVY